MWHPSWKLNPHLWLGLVEARKDIPSREVFIERQQSSGMSLEEAENRLNSFSPLYTKQFRMFLTWWAVALAVTLCIVSAILDLSAISNGTVILNWFPRSGAIMVAVALWLEFEPTRLNSSPINIPAYTVTQRYMTWLKAFNTIGVWVAISGTVIWAYGDILLTYLFH